MNKSPLKLLLILVFSLGLLIFINRQFFDNKISFNFLPRYGQESSAYIFKKLSIFKNIAASLGTISNLVNRNIELEKTNSDLLSKISKMEITNSETSFLKKAVGIKEDIKSDLKIGNIYAWSLGPNGYSVLLNKGEADSISIGDILISEEKVLIGTVEKVENNFSRILTVIDPGFRITAKVIGSDTIGIANGALNDGLSFNLIVQDDKIAEGDVVVSSGNDIFPDSLIIGKVSKVELTENQLFKKVLIEPAMKDIILGSVIIIK